VTEKKILVRPGAFHKLKSLDPKLLAEIDLKLGTNTPALNVAEWLQKDRNVFAEDNTMTLKKMLERYRKFELKKKIIDRIAGVQSLAATKTVVKRLNALELMEEAVARQLQRIEKLAAKEDATPFLLKDMTINIDLYNRMCSNLFHMQVEAGVIARAPKKFSGTITNPDGSKYEFEWAEEQQQLYETLEALKDGAPQKS